MNKIEKPKNCATRNPQLSLKITFHIPQKTTRKQNTQKGNP